MISALNNDFQELNSFIKHLSPSKLFFLVDENTHEYCLPTLLANLETEIPFEILEIEAGEEMKTIETAAQLWQILAEFEADRKSLIINLGGGVITDLGGFVASTYKRGIPFINIPTSLLAMCDASIGGKTGIDHSFLKNIVGTFALPLKIFYHPNFLKTLPFSELRSGFAEMLKHGIIADHNHWQQLISLDTLSPEHIAPHIGTSMEIKQRVVNEDFKEENIRKTLNFGHTIGHALESLFIQNGNPIPHGEAVALGMIFETELSHLEGLISKEKAEFIISQIKKFYPYINIPFANEDILSLMVNDKKNTNGNINFSLITDIENCIFDYKANTKNVISALNLHK